LIGPLRDPAVYERALGVRGHLVENQMSAKFNIHLTVDDGAMEYCLMVNDGLRAITDSVIRFGRSSTMTPHVSLLMGELHPATELRTLADLTRSVVEGQAVVTFFVDAPRLEKGRNRYVLSDLRESSDFLVLWRRLKAVLDGPYLKVPNDQTADPHLTLGYIEGDHQAVEAYLRSIRAGFRIRCPEVEISNVGPKGTCVDSLFRFALK
jgi:hypothetical protein